MVDYLWNMNGSGSVDQIKTIPDEVIVRKNLRLHQNISCGNHWNCLGEAMPVSTTRNVLVQTWH